MQADHPEDLAFLSENRRRRRLGLPEERMAYWPSREYWRLTDDLYAVCLAIPMGMPQRIPREMACLAFETSESPGQHARLTERAVALLAAARVIAMRSRAREPGEDDE